MELQKNIIPQSEYVSVKRMMQKVFKLLSLIQVIARSLNFYVKNKEKTKRNV